jgi:Zinc finger, C3HC4 type (RING finger)
MSKRTDDIMNIFNQLKAQYEATANSNVNILDEDNEQRKTEMDDHQDLIEKMDIFSLKVKKNMLELKKINHEIFAMQEYKQKLLDVLSDMNSLEHKYKHLFSKNTLIDLEVEKPIENMKKILVGQGAYVPYSLQQLLTTESTFGAHSSLGEYRAEVTDANTKINSLSDITRFTRSSYLFKDPYVTSIKDICDKIDERIETKKEEIAKLNESINVYKRALKSFETDKTLFGKYKCTICFENEVTHCLMPCGHTFCDACSKKLQKKCFACNGEVKTVTKMFMLGNDDNEVTEPEYVNPTLPHQTIHLRFANYN